VELGGQRAGLECVETPAGSSLCSISIKKEILIMSKKENKCWRYSRNPDDKNDKDWYIFAFVNALGSCSLTRFEAADGKHIETIYKTDDFQDNFPEYLIPVSFPLSLSHQPSLVEARKERLPKWALFEIKKQVIELTTSSLLAILDR